MPNATYAGDTDIRANIVSVLSINPDGEDKSLDLTAFIERGAHAGGGGYGEVYEVKWRDGICDNPSRELPRLAIKVMRATVIVNEADKIKRDKVLP